MGKTESPTFPDYSSVQSSYRPLGWAIYDKVQIEVPSLDPLAQDFQNNLSSFTQYTSSLKEGVAYAAANNNQLDPRRLYFFSAYAPRIYFISNGGWYTDALGVTIGPATAPSSQAPQGTNYVVFPNANSNYSNNCPTKQVGNTRTTAVPLLTGDFVQLPMVQAGQQLSLVFFSNLDSNGNVPSGYTFYNYPQANADGYQHMVGFFPNSSQYIIVGFEDEYGGGDGDFNDVIVVIDVGSTNAAMWQNASSLPR
jgi:hypothetical protein